MLLDILIFIFVVFIIEFVLKLGRFSLKTILNILLAIGGLVLALIVSVGFIGGMMVFIGWSIMLIIKVTFAIAILSVIYSILKLIWKVIKNAIN